MPKELGKTLVKSNVDLIEHIKQLMDANDRFEVMLSKGQPGPELSHFVRCMSEVCRIFCTKSKHSANLFFMIQAYNIIVQPVEEVV